MKTLRYPMYLAVFLPLVAGGYPRSDMPSISFEYKDWQLVCDNTRTCRAAGYHQEDDGPNATILLTRAAGQRQMVKAELRLADDNEPMPTAVAMSVDGRALGTIRLDKDEHTGHLSDSQTAALLPALLAGRPVAWTSGATSWTVSSAGSTAVLLKMDDFQGRIDTPGALVRKGGKPETGVQPALPLPHIPAARVLGKTRLAHPFSAAAQRELMAALGKTVKDDECTLLDSTKPADTPLDGWQLDKEHLLVAHLCWRGAYNEGYGYWVVANHGTYDPVLVTTSASDYANGVISSAQRGRGIGDCMALADWTWDGRTFSQTSAATTGMCRQIAAGGAWTLPTIVTQTDKPH